MFDEEQLDPHGVGNLPHVLTITNKGGAALEPILFTSNFWQAKNWEKFCKFQILAVIASDEHVLTKTSLVDIYITRFTELTLRRFFPRPHALDSPLSSKA